MPPPSFLVMLHIEVRKHGLDVAVLAAKFPGELRRFVNNVGDFAFTEMKIRAPFKTGKMRSSVKKRVSGLEVRIGPTVPYAIHVEEGTAPHDIYPVNARALRFVVAGQVVFAMHVRHPGTKPQPFVRETLEETRKIVPRVWRSMWQEIEVGV